MIKTDELIWKVSTHPVADATVEQLLKIEQKSWKANDNLLNLITRRVRRESFIASVKFFSQLFLAFLLLLNCRKVFKHFSRNFLQLVVRPASSDFAFISGNSLRENEDKIFKLKFSDKTEKVFLTIEGGNKYETS